MKNIVQFETPENVKVTYEIAGLGSRFVAWIEDQLILSVAMFILFIILAFAGIGSSFLNDLFIEMGENPDDVSLYFFGVITVIMGLGSFVYYGASELFLRGQTIGKRHNNIRVVKANGFSLDPGSIMLRNLFRIIDHIPITWLVPALSRNSQRLGDMLAGTLCVVDDPSTLGSLRETLLARPATDRHFRIDVTALQRLRPQDFEAVERVLENLDSVPPAKQHELCAMLCVPLARRMQINEPEPDLHRRFLEDLMAAEYRRQQRNLG